MFWQKKEKFDWHLMFFGFIALGIILSVAILVVILVNKSQTIKSNLNSVPILADKNYEQIILVKQNYKQEITKLANTILAENDLNHVYVEVDEVFLQIRVPAELRDLHLQTLLKVHEFKGQNLALEKVKVQIQEMLEKLLEG